MIINMIRIILSTIIIWIIFTIIFSFFEESHFSGIDDKNDFLTRVFNRSYLTLTTMSTVGYGDMYPASMPTRSLNMILMFIVLWGVVTSLIPDSNLTIKA